MIHKASANLLLSSSFIQQGKSSTLPRQESKTTAYKSTTFSTRSLLLMFERDLAKRGPTSNPVTGGGVCISTYSREKLRFKGKDGHIN